MSKFVHVDSQYRDKTQYPNAADFIIKAEDLIGFDSSARQVRSGSTARNLQQTVFAYDIQVSNLVVPAVTPVVAEFLGSIAPIGGSAYGRLTVTGITKGEIITNGYTNEVTKSGLVTTTTSILNGATSGMILTGPGVAANTIIVSAEPGVPNSYIVYPSQAVGHVTIKQVQKFIREPVLYLDFHSTKYNDSWPINTIKGQNSDGRFVLTLREIQYEEDGVTPRWYNYKSDMHQVMRFEIGQPLVFRLFNSAGIPLYILDEDVENFPAIISPTNHLVFKDTWSVSQVLCTFAVTPYNRDGEYTNQFADLKVPK